MEQIRLTDEDVFYIGMDLSKGGGTPCDITDSIKAGANAQLKKYSNHLLSQDNLLTTQGRDVIIRLTEELEG